MLAYWINNDKSVASLHQLDDLDVLASRSCLLRELELSGTSDEPLPNELGMI